MLAAIRRRVGVIAGVVLSVQMFVPALGTARVCLDGEHTHGGIPAPDCAMHHHATPSSDVAAEHAHHGHGVPSSAGSAHIACRCSEQPPSAYSGQLALIENRIAALPFLQAAPMPVTPAVPAIDYRFSPPSPPPR